MYLQKKLRLHACGKHFIIDVYGELFKKLEGFKKFVGVFRDDYH